MEINRFEQSSRRGSSSPSKFFNEAREGIGMNLLVYKKPTILYTYDECPFGIGDYCSKESGWRWKIPEGFQF